MTPTETLVAELEALRRMLAHSRLPQLRDHVATANTAISTLTTQSALIETLQTQLKYFGELAEAHANELTAQVETLTRERDEARVLAGERERKAVLRQEAAEAALADARNKALEEAALVVNAARGSGWNDLRSVIARIRALKSA
jgi:hypothetical protein